MMRPRTQLLIGLVSLALSVGLALVRDRLPEHTGNVLTDAPRRIADILLPRDSDVISAVVPNGTTVAGMLGKHLLPESELSALVQAVTSSFDVRKLRAGNIYKIERLFDGRIRSFEYEIDPTRALRASRRDGDIALFEAEVVELPRTTTRVVVEGTDRPRRAVDQRVARARRRAARSGAGAGRHLRRRDRLQQRPAARRLASALVVEKSVRDDGVFVGYGPVQAAEFLNDGRTLTAMRFLLPSGKPGYFDRDGLSLTRFFLKSPLKFEPRITSTLLALAHAPGAQVRPRPQRRRLRRADRRAGRERVERRRHAGRLDRRRRPHRAREARQRLRERVHAPVGDCRRHPCRAPAWARARWSARSA